MSQKEIRELLIKAERSLRAAERLLDDGDADFCVTRAYYAMFYAAQALLLSRDVRRSKDSAVMAALGTNSSKRHRLHQGSSSACARRLKEGPKLIAASR